MKNMNPFTKQLSFIKNESFPNKRNPALWFIFKGDKIALTPGDPCPHIPLLSHSDLPFKHPLAKHYIGTYGKTDCFGVGLQEHEQLPTTTELYTFRSLLALLPKDLFTIAGRAKQLIYFHKTQKYCGQCGTITLRSNTEDARTCPGCSQIYYPRLSPVVIMTVAKGNQLLLARSPHFPEEMYSCLAGFIEPGETAEEAVAREVMEETQVKVKNIQYITSQPWPFPHSLMFGFSSDYKSGTILIDDVEIEDAAWFTENNLPQLPSTNSIAGFLIDRFLRTKI